MRQTIVLDSMEIEGHGTAVFEADMYEAAMRRTVADMRQELVGKLGHRRGYRTLIRRARKAQLAALVAELATSVRAQERKAEREQEALREACRAEHRVSVRYDAGRHYPYTPACSHCGDLSWGYVAEHAAQLIADDHAAQWAPEKGSESPQEAPTAPAQGHTSDLAQRLVRETLRVAENRAQRWESYGHPFDRRMARAFRAMNVYPAGPSSVAIRVPEYVDGEPFGADWAQLGAECLDVAAMLVGLPFPLQLETQGVTTVINWELD